MAAYGYVPQGGAGDSRQPAYGMPPGPGSSELANGAVPQPLPLPVNQERIVLRQWSTIPGLIILAAPSLVGAVAILGGAWILSTNRQAWAQLIFLFALGGLLVLVGCVLFTMRSVLGPEGIELRTAFGSTSVPWPTTRNGIAIGSQSGFRSSPVRASVWLNVIDPRGTPVRLTGLTWMGLSVSSLIPRATAEADRIWAWAWERGYIQAARAATASMPQQPAANPRGGAGIQQVDPLEEFEAIIAEVEAVEAERERRRAAGGALHAAQELPASVPTPYDQWPGLRPVARPLPLGQEKIILHRWSLLVSLRKIAVMALFTVPVIAWGVHLFLTEGSLWLAALLIVPASLALAGTCVRATSRTCLDARGITVRSMVRSRRWPWPTSRTAFFAGRNTLPRPGVAGSRVALVRPDGEPKPLPGTDTEGAGYEDAERAAVEQADRIWGWACGRGYARETGEYTYLVGVVHDDDQSWRNRQEKRHGLTPGNHPPRP